MNNPYKMNNYFSFFCIFATISLLFSCATGTNSTGTKIELNKGNKNNIQKLGVVIEEKEDLSVWSERDESSILADGLVGAMGLVTLPIGLVLKSIDTSTRNEKDEESTSSIESSINEYSISDDFQNKICNYAVNANLFDKIVKLNLNDFLDGNESDVDAVLRVTLLNWGLRRVSDTKENYKNKLLKTEFKIKAEIIPFSSTSALTNTLSAPAISKAPSGSALNSKPPCA